MTDREALFAAILANPTDDVPRLVFADWLDEHGEPERAEFIRVQCELARMEEDDRGDVEPYRYVGWDTGRPLFVGPPADEWRARDPEAFERAALATREWELRKQLLPRLVLELPQVMRGTEYAPPTFRRGFAAYWSTGLDTEFLRDAPAVFRRVPVEIVTFEDDLRADAIDRLVASGYLGRVSGLRLRRSERSAALLEELARSPAAQSITSLQLDADWETDYPEDVENAYPERHVAVVTAFPNLRRFEAGYAPPLPTDELARLFTSQTGQGLTHLTLNHGQYDTSAANVLASFGSPNLRVLDLSYNPLQFDPRVAECGPGFPNLRTLNLAGCRSTAEMAGRLLRSPAFPRLSHLVLSSNLLTASAEYLPHGEDPSPLRTLQVVLDGFTQIGRDWPPDVAALAACPALAGLLKLSLPGQLIGDHGAVRLAESAVLRNLVTLTISNSVIGSEGAAALANSPHLAGLAQLDLTDNVIGREGAEALARSPHLTKLAALLVDDRTPGLELLKAHFGDALHAIDDSIPF